jgi:hypothetical protein
MDQSLVDERILQGRITELREKGYTWEDVAAMLGCGECWPSIVTLEKRAFHVRQTAIL